MSNRMSPPRSMQLQANCVQRLWRKEGKPISRYLTLYPRPGLEPDEARDRSNAMEYLTRRGLWPPRPGDTREDRVAYEYLVVVAWRGIASEALTIDLWPQAYRRLVEAKLAGRLLSMQLKDEQ